MMSERRHESNFLNPDINPCIEESLLSQRCLDEKLYDYNECAYYFENYKQCKKFWVFYFQKRQPEFKRKGLSPGKMQKANGPNAGGFKTSSSKGIISKKRKVAGIKPFLPTKTERDEILRLKTEGKHVFSADSTG